MILHTFSAYPEAMAAISDCLRVASPNDVIFCRDDSVYVFRQTDASQELLSARPDIRYSALFRDLEIRGISSGSLLSGVDLLTSASFISLCAEAEKVIHWG